MISSSTIHWVQVVSAAFILVSLYCSPTSKDTPDLTPFLVQSKHNARYYAVKVLAKDKVVRLKQVEHTNSERAMLGACKHPFLVNLWGTFQDSKNLFMVMDFVAGGELFTLIRKSTVCYFNGSSTTLH